jgi:hypothetical protein
MMPEQSSESEIHQYLDPSTDEWMSPTQLQAAAAETQLGVMEHWFYQNYSDPVENTPYESAEGGYQYIWGGPYSASVELEAEFGGIVPDDVLELLVEKLERVTVDWTGNPDELTVDDYLFDSIGSSGVYRASLHAAINTIEQSLSVSMAEPLRQNFCRMLFGNVVAALEAYLSDFFISALKEDGKLLRKLVESNKEFKERKIPLSDVFKSHDGIEMLVKEFLTGLTWHNLPRIRPLYGEVIDITFDDAATQELIRAVVVRHDIVHRNGKTKDGRDVLITEDDINKLLENVKKLVRGIEDQWFDKCHVPTLLHNADQQIDFLDKL